MDDKTLQRIKKLQALAERGVGGEKETATKMLNKILKDNGISSLEELEDDKVECQFFAYKGQYERKLLVQCAYKVIGYTGDDTLATYESKSSKGRRIGVYCTKAQQIEIKLEFDFYRKILSEEMDTFVNAFIQAQHIFPNDAPEVERGLDEMTEKEINQLTLAKSIKKQTRNAMLETQK